ncbi:acyltransferase [Rothia dentocariosa]|uniref:acyltransferase family protein n=1 Tax=Rothia dentocariosa TaxID=2047 RepID=UPI00244B1AC3|nr:acyltransferase [Rothia dentocariosa]
MSKESTPVMAGVPSTRYVMLDSLTILRGPAALFVFFYHTRWAHVVPSASVGYVGVALFFVLSGFVLTWSYKPADGAKKFYLRRFARVYPLHLFFFALALAILVLTQEAPSAGATLSNLVLLHAWVPNWDYIFSVNGVSWSLGCEAFFYACTPLVLGWLSRRSPKAGYTVLTGWFLLTAAVTSAIALTSNYADVVVYANPLLRSGEFALGMLLGLLALKVRDGVLAMPRIRTWQLWVVTALALAGISGVSKVSLPQTINGFVLDPVWFLLIGMFALHDIQRAQSHHQVGEPVPGNWICRSLVYFGEVSFAFYLVHEIVIFRFIKTSLGSDMIRMDARGILMMLIILVISILAAMIAHHLVERPARIMILKASTRTL